MKPTLLLRGALGALLALGGPAGCATDTDERPQTADYIAAAILAPSCGRSTCHTSIAKLGGYVFDNVADAKASLRRLVKPGEPESQQRLLRVMGAAGNTPEEIMPPEAPLPEADLDLIRAWIAGGAAGLP